MRRLLACLTFVSLSAVAYAVDVQLAEVPGSGGRWHSGSTVIPAEVDRVRGWLTDYDHWPRLFSDITASRSEGVTDDGAAIVRFHSRIVQRTIVIRERRTPFGLSYEGGSAELSVQGRIFLVDLGDGRTRVIMQSSSQVHGPLRHFITERMVRAREDAMMRADLSSLYELSQLPPRLVDRTATRK